MKARKKPVEQKSFLLPTLAEQLDASCGRSTNYLKGFAGDARNLLLAAAAWNFKKWLNLVVSFWLNCLRWPLLPSEYPALRLTSL